MKNQLKLWRSGLVALFLFIFTNGVYAQLEAPNPTLPIIDKAGLDLGTLDNGVGTVTDQTNTVFFYNPAGTSIRLNASLEDANGLEFTSYIWYKIDYNGVDETPTVVVDETEDALELTDLQPGYYKYRVYGLVDDGTVICQSDEYQDVVFFVLRPVDPTANPAAESITEYCENDAPSTGLTLDATIAFDSEVEYQGGYPNPTVDEFAMTYRWYAINIDVDEDEQIELPYNVSPVSGATNSITIDDYADLLTPGTYHFYVEVQYSEAIKERGSRAHALWTAQVGGSTDPYELVVTPKPGRPTITIEAIID